MWGVNGEIVRKVKRKRREREKEIKKGFFLLFFLLRRSERGSRMPVHFCFLLLLLLSRLLLFKARFSASGRIL